MLFVCVEQLESCRSLFVHESAMLQSVMDKLFTLLEAPDPSINLAAMPSATVVTASPEVNEHFECFGSSFIPLSCILILVHEITCLMNALWCTLFSTSF